MSERVTIVGAGVVGLSVAHDLAATGRDVTVVADERWDQTCSATAGAIWFPFEVDAGPESDRLLQATLRRFDALSRSSPEAGVDQRFGRLIERTPLPDRSWTEHLPQWQEAEDLLPGTTGVRARVPMITMSDYLPWLEREVRQRGARFERRHVNDIAELAGSADVVVVAAGLRSSELVPDDEPTVPVRGQVLRVENIGPDRIDEWVIDEQHPGGLTYVLPRRDCLVLGGTAEPGATDLTIDPAVEAGILERCAEYFPAVAGRRVVSRGVALRPRRATVRIEETAFEATRVLTAYGHGGAGVTLSWGTAEQILRLL